MFLWIRSQDKKYLIKVDNFVISEKENKAEICSIANFSQYCTLGEYSKERALEVLDDIQKYLIPSLDMLGKIPEDGKIYGVNSIVSMVYQMPEE